MANQKKNYVAQAAEVARELGISVRSVMNSGILKPMSEHARQTLIAGLRKAREPHGEPMLVGRGELAIQETADEIRIVIRKQPQAEKPTAGKGETQDVIAVRRAGECA